MLALASPRSRCACNPSIPGVLVLFAFFIVIALLRAGGWAAWLSGGERSAGSAALQRQLAELRAEQLRAAARRDWGTAHRLQQQAAALAAGAPTAVTPPPSGGAEGVWARQSTPLPTPAPPETPAPPLPPAAQVPSVADPLLTLEALAAGVVVAGAAGRFARRLRDGGPVRVVAFGGSVTEGYGGCWSRVGCQTSLVRPAAGPLAAAEWSQQPRARSGEHLGWLARAMQLVNTTWPHRDHAAANFGRSATGPAAPVSSWGCFSGRLAGFAPDLVIIEMAINLATDDDVDGPLRQLVRHALSLPSAPAVAFLNLAVWCVGEHKGSPGCVRAAAAGEPAQTTEDEGRIERLAQEHGAAALSVRRALSPAATASSAERFTADGKHPCRARCPAQSRSGRPALYGDYIARLLHHWLRRVADGAAAGNAWRPPPPLPGAAAPVATRCYRLAQPRPTKWGGARDAATGQWVSKDGVLRPAVATAASAARPQEVPPWWDLVPTPQQRKARVPPQEPWLSGEPPGGGGWFEFPFQLGGPQGYKARGRQARAKGGLYSLRDGDEANFTLDASHASAVELIYLEGYEGVGAATVDCPEPGGCSCRPQLIVAWRPLPRTTIDVTARFNLTPASDAARASRCIVRLRNSYSAATALLGQGAAPSFKISGVNVHFGQMPPPSPTREGH
eukprot:TRINITY_DN8312_c0_g1_i1.p1 TRINITY_DN8312_c0_g1~~TRINITY_DN8312_c0_g1_i1.p1  ORF type:complete len:704 (+),score=135.43 TRINITY_DN8312_c0_g1_i1:89-2113(+)